MTGSNFVDRVINPAKTVEIAVVGKYIHHWDAYKSIMESFVHAGAENNAKVILRLLMQKIVKPEITQNFLEEFQVFWFPADLENEELKEKFKL